MLQQQGVPQKEMARLSWRAKVFKSQKLLVVDNSPADDRIQRPDILDLLDRH
jgi:hypothetical protein